VRDLADGQLWLNIGATRIPARIASGNAAGPNNGERLQLRVLRDHPVLALETLEPETEADTNTVSDALRRFLPRQSSPAPLLSNLAWLAAQPDQGAVQNRLPRAVGEALQRLWTALPDAAQLSTPDGLANAVKRSGVFLESTLASQLSHGDTQAARQTLAHDIKALLVQLKQALTQSGASTPSPPTQAGPLPTLRGSLQPIPAAQPSFAHAEPIQPTKELAAQTDGALARIQTIQLVDAEPSATPTWLVELPLRHDGRGEMLRMRMARHSKPDAADQSWTIEAAMEMSGGALHARVSLYGKRVGVQLRAEPPALVAELSAHSGLLSAMLSNAGLDVDRVVCMNGLPADHGGAESTGRLQTLLDVRV
jgi:hypothetical protein